MVVNPDEAVARYYQQEAWVQAQIRRQQQAWLDKAGRTEDGIRLRWRPIAHSVEATAAFNNGAQSVGLFRTECSIWTGPARRRKTSCITYFARRWSRPTAQTSAPWISAATKPVAYLNIPAENNPFLGYRAVRIYEEYQALFRTQLRAILRASRTAR